MCGDRELTGNYKLAVIAGDGIGKEVMPAGKAVLDRVADVCGFKAIYTDFDWSCATYARTGRIMPEDGLDQLRDHDAIMLGAVGWPGVPDHISLWDLLIPIRRSFEQYVNLRPVKLLPGITPPLRDREAGEIAYWIVRENTEGEYSQVGGRMHSGTSMEMACQLAVFTRTGTDRIITYAFELAGRLGTNHVSSATKSNGIFHSMPFWDERFAEISNTYQNVKTDSHHIDILAARLVTQPEFFDVIVASNLFGDILSDLGPATTGTIAVAPSANLNPEREFPSMFEPVHGSAPDIAGHGIANPIGMIWSVQLMLEHLGQGEAASLIGNAIASVMACPEAPLTPDMGGSAKTDQMTMRICSEIK